MPHCPCFTQNLCLSWARVELADVAEENAVFRTNRLQQKPDASGPHALHEEEVGRLEDVEDVFVVHPQDPRVHEVHQVGQRPDVKKDL